MRHLPQHLQSGAVRFKATFHVGTQPLLYNKQHTPFYTPPKKSNKTRKNHHPLPESAGDVCHAGKKDFYATERIVHQSAFVAGTKPVQSCSCWSSSSRS